MARKTEPSTYSEINVPTYQAQPRKVIEIELDDMPEPVDHGQDIDIEDTELETPTTEVTQPVEQPRQQPQREHRSQKRIRELAAEKNSLAAELAEERKQMANLRKQLQEGNKNSNTALKENLEGQVTMLNQQLRTAVQEGDADGVVTIQQQLMKTQIKLDQLEHAIKVTPVEVRQDEPRRQAGPSQEALRWVEDHPTFKTDPVFHGAAMAVNNTLVQEGFDPEDSYFYEVLTQRLAPRFPDVFGTAPTNDVEYDEVETTPPARGVKTQPRQTVSGASRTPAATPNTPRNQRQGNKVYLTKEDLALADKWGWSHERMARRKLHIEQTSEGGYSPIIIPEKK